jgi:hypothetical protein
VNCPPLRLRLRDTAGQVAGLRAVELIVRRGLDLLHETHITVPSLLDDRLRDELRWYLEEFPRSPFDPAPAMAGRIAEKLRGAGEELFTALVRVDPAGWLERCLREDLRTTRIEVASDATVASAWEMLRDPETGALPALASRALVRVLANDHTTAPAAPVIDAGLRILLVISRPSGPDDVPFQSIARPMLEALARVPKLELKVMRPATWPRLLEVLKEAQMRGRPFAAVHFDGHGLLQGGRGHLVFEGTDSEHPTWVTGAVLGKALKQAGVPLAILNACRSAAAPLPRFRVRRPNPSLRRQWRRA